MSAAFIKSVKMGELGRRIYGWSWITRLSEHRGTDIRTVQRWAKGAREAPDELIDELRASEEAQSRLRIDEPIWDIVREAQARGGDPYLIAAELEKISAELRGKPVDGDNFRDPEDLR